MKKLIAFVKTFFYFRTGYATYFALMVGVINILTTTYFLAVDKIPFLLNVFPTFEIYVVTLIFVGIPVVIGGGWMHMKKIGSYAAEANITTEESPYQYKYSPGFLKEVFGPAYLAIINMQIKKIKGEKLTESELESIKEIDKKLSDLIKGGYAGHPPKGVF